MNTANLTRRGVLPQFPHAWTLELHRNGSGRAFYFVSRFINPHEVEYLTDIAGEPRCFRVRPEAETARDAANERAIESHPVIA